MAPQIFKQGRIAVDFKRYIKIVLLVVYWTFSGWKSEHRPILIQSLWSEAAKHAIDSQLSEVLKRVGAVNPETCNQFSIIRGIEVEGWHS